MIIVPEMWTITQAREKTGFSRVFLMELIKSGKIKYVKAGKKYIINAESLCEYLTNCDNTSD